MPLGEFAIIDRFFRDAGLVREDVVLGIGDDGAILRPPAGFDLIAVSDTLVEGVHFPAGAAPRSIGHRALAVNLSDIAAMGAEPAWSLLALTLPRIEESWLAEFTIGFATLAREHGVALVGGDTTRGPLTLGVQVMGFVPEGRGLRRTGGRPGDLLCVSGTPGDAAAGLASLRRAAGTTCDSPDAAERQLRARFEYPTPRLALGRALRDVASACIDVSDGLAGDLDKLAVASGCTAVLDLDRLPRSAALQSRVQTGGLSAQDALRLALAGGDDYELAFAVPPARRAALEPWLAHGEVTLIGELVEKQSGEVAEGAEGGNVLLRRGTEPLSAADLRSLDARGFDHFAP